MSTWSDNVQKNVNNSVATVQKVEEEDLEPGCAKKCSDFMITQIKAFQKLANIRLVEILIRRRELNHLTDDGSDSRMSNSEQLPETTSDDQPSGDTNEDPQLSQSTPIQKDIQKSVYYIMQFVHKFKEDIRRLTPKSAFPEDGRINEESLVKAVNKNALTKWLGTAMDLLERAENQIQGAMKLESQINSKDTQNRNLLQEKVEDQKKIIHLQSLLIEKKQEDVKCLQETVHEEIKTYAEMLSTSCAKALSPKKLENVVKKIQDAEDRSRNLIIFGLTEENGENLNAKVGEMFTYLEEKPLFSTPTRIGNSSGGSVRPVKLSLASATMVSPLLAKSQRLRQSNIFKSVYISPDRTKEERMVRRTLVNELREKRKDNPDLIFVIRKGKVLSV
ncbi:hypothetical protein ACHWQZ_G001725 [Mnemiopsis leidyi]